MASLLAAALAAVLVGASAGGPSGLAAVLAATQVALVAGWFARARLTGRGQGAGALVAMAGGIAADATLLIGGGAIDRQLGRLVGVLAAVVGLAFAAQLARRDGRSRLAESLAATVATGALAIAGAVLLAVRAGRGGLDVVAIALVAAGVALLPVQRWVPLGVAVPVGAVLGVVAGVAAGLPSTLVERGPAAAVAAVAAVAALAARAASGPSAGSVAQRLAGAVVSSAAPMLLIAPGVLVVARILIG